MTAGGTILGLAWRSLLNRKGTALVTVFAIAVSVALLIGVERIRGEARTSFANTISGTDLIVGARSGPINLLLYSVFRIGNATNNISWESYERWASNPQVSWTIPLSLGDSHRGFRVLGTTGAYFEHYRFARDRGLSFAAGGPFESELDAVVGADVARELGYAVGDEIVVSHGIGATSFVHHDDKPFTVTGILAKTGTPVDRTVHVSLAGIDAMHEGWPDAGGAAGGPMVGARLPSAAAAPRADEDGKGARRDGRGRSRRARCGDLLLSPWPGEYLLVLRLDGRPGVDAEPRPERGDAGSHGRLRTPGRGSAQDDGHDPGRGGRPRSLSPSPLRSKVVNPPD